MEYTASCCVISETPSREANAVEVWNLVGRSFGWIVTLAFMFSNPALLISIPSNSTLLALGSVESLHSTMLSLTVWPGCVFGSIDVKFGKISTEIPERREENLRRFSSVDFSSLTSLPSILSVHSGSPWLPGRSLTCHG
ncbi:hypothetical protein WICPIJ_007769 [Wickerhamomyces pijperi]|uniref:Uncharacterized protein n=1 Tax=Wickerhamomyces pijperi TaxID=599730 RepID=A0A9P8Q1S7_WICPI|nr:hypothetical protein WICPIJ_007769 [Wickerhamomyces pijperi]